MTTSSHEPDPSLGRLFFGDGTLKKAVLTALIVGTILTLINHGDVLSGGGLPPIWKILLTYIVPYCVTTYGAFSGKTAQIRHAKSVGSSDLEASEPKR